MKRRRLLRVGLAPVLALATLTLVTGGALAASGLPAGASTLPTCPIKALKAAKGTVDITFWESTNNANLTVLTGLTNAFNSSQSKIHVSLVTQAGYDDTWAKYTAGLSSGNLPDLAQIQDINLQEAIDTRSFLPAQSCINATHYSTKDFLPRALDYWKVDGVQEALPWAVSTPVLYYNKNSFSAAGLDPNSPPATLAEMLSDAAALKAHGIGTGVVLDPWYLETWLSTADKPFVNNGNGRSSRATKAVFSTPAATQIFTDLSALVNKDGGVTNPSTGSEAFDDLLGIGSGKYGMAIDTSAALGTIYTVLKNYPNVSLGVGPFPVLSQPAKGGIEAGGSALYISDKVPPAAQAAAWEFAEYLDTTQNMATWAAGSGYIPIRKSSIATATIQSLWASQPAFKIAYDQLESGANSAATAGAVVGPYEQVRSDELDAQETMYLQGVAPKTALAAAAKAVDATIAQYNQRLGD
jgi:sn-glycerol 3-phosphate transport system substrate-binding protein